MQEKLLKILEFDKIILQLVSECATNLGIELANNLVPINNLENIESLQEETSQAVRFIHAKGTPPFAGLKDIRQSLIKVGKGAILSAGELLDIASSLRASRNIKLYFNFEELNKNNDSNDYFIILLLVKGVYQNARVEEKIFSCIISDDEIADNASPLLSSLRRQIFNLEQEIKDKLNRMIHSSNYQKYLQEGFVTMRSGRYVLPVKQEYRSEIPGLVHDSSASGATLFIEPTFLVDGNNQIKQLKIKEEQEIERILFELTELVSNIVTELSESIEILAKLDFIFAKAKLGLKYNAAKPSLNYKGSISLIKARHPLIDPEKVVPITAYFQDNYNTLVITGPNTGGKTVTLKTIGLLTLMAQAGLHIPVEQGSTINVFNKIFADIGDEQSIEQNLSTFSSHMKNIINILENVEENSLVLFDELGSGTDPVEGSAIAMSILEYLHERNVITVATTHYSELKIFALKTEGIENASCEFNIETLMPTYRLLIGIPGKSNAFAISKKLGLEENILGRAKELISTEESRFEDVIASVEKNRHETEKALLEIESIKAESIKLKASLDRQRADFENQKQKLLRDAKYEARRIIQAAKEDAENALEEMRRLSEVKTSELNKKGEEIKSKLRNKIKDTEDRNNVISFEADDTETNYDFKAGDNVYVKNIKQNGVVLTNTDENNNVFVQVGVLKINISSSMLRPVKEKKKAETQVNLKNITSTKERTAPLELDLRGQTLDEATANTDMYLDNVFLSGIKQVTIIHGKGTGVLRNGIHQLLKRHPHVKSYRLGVFGEGENGVTIVELN